MDTKAAGEHQLLTVSDLVIYLIPNVLGSCESEWRQIVRKLTQLCLRLLHFIHCHSLAIYSV